MFSIANAARTATALLILIACTCGNAAASDALNVRPVRLDLSNDERSAVLTVTNQNATPEILRIEADAWDQTSGVDSYNLIDEQLFVVPPVLNIDPGQSKIVRVGLRKPVSGSREQAYRVFISQVPVDLEGISGVQIAFRVGIPIFVTQKALNAAEKTSSSPSLTWTAKLDGPDHVRLSAENASKAHVHIDAVHIYTDAAQQKLATEVMLSDYVLAGAARTFDLHTPTGMTLPTVVVEGSDTNEQRFSVTVPVSWK